VGYFKDTLKGLSWMGALRGAGRLMAVIRIAVLARLLAPQQFGLFAIASLAIALLEMLTETGINVFFIQEKDRVKTYLDTAWMISIVRGFVIFLVLLITAPFIAQFFKNQDAVALLRVISIVPLLRGFINPAEIKFQKKLQFSKEFRFRFFIFLFDGIVAIIAALVTRSVYSLVLGLISGVILEIAISFLFIKPVPKLSFESVKIKKIVGRGKWVTLAGIFNYLFHNGDDIVVGRLMDSYYLGVYQLAYKITSLPIYEAGEVFGKVTFPVYAKIAGDKKRLKKAFIKITLAISAFVIPFGLILFLFPKQLVLLLLGDKWLDAVPVIRVLSVFGVIRAISGSSSALFLAINKQEYVTALTFVSIIGLALTIVPLVDKYGILGAGYSALIGTFLAIPVIGFYLLRIFKN